MALVFNHQSSLGLSMRSKILQSEKNKAIGRKELFEFAFGMGMTL